MKQLVLSTIAFLSLTGCILAQEEAQTTKETPAESQKHDIIKISEAFGFLMGKNIESMGVKFDIDHFVKGLQDAAAGKDCPMTEMECIQAITSVQESAFKEQAQKNLSMADTFLETNKTHEGVICLEEGKVQYKIDKAGQGSCLQENSSPLVRYTGKFLDGSTFGSSSEDEPISMEEVIPGLKTGMVGMQEGEKRTIYIHPDLAYGTKGGLPPNSLLTFEIEIVKAEAPITEDNSVKMSETGEIAIPEGLSIEQAR